jgi:hypothetical protein
VDSVELFHSVLKRAGAEYRELKAVHLKSDRS